MAIYIKEFSPNKGSRAIASTLYRVMLVVWQLGWVEIDLGYYITCWAAGVMAEWAEQVGRLVELENLSQHNQLPDHQHHPVLTFVKFGFLRYEMRFLLHLLNLGYQHYQHIL